MKTKTLVLTTLLSLASSASLFAQVYSQNIVGFVSANLGTGFNTLCNPLVSGTNGIAQILPTVANGTLIYKYLPNGTYNIDFHDSGVWYDFITENVSTTTLAPGEGFFVFANAPMTLTFVGEIKTGSTSVTLNNGFTLVGSAVPQRYELLSPDFPVANGMQHYKFNNVDSSYTISIYDSSIGWFDAITESPVQVHSAPADALATGFFIFNPTTATPWTRSYNL